MIVLGLSAFYHDSAAALLRDGVVVAAAQEERFSRKKHDSGFPADAVRYCLDAAGVRLNDVDHVAFYEKPFLTFDRLIETYFAFAPHGYRSFSTAMPVWLREKFLQKPTLIRELNDLGRGSVGEEKMTFSVHHHSHAASAFFPSPFSDAAILIMDGVGEWATTTLGHGRDGTIELSREIRFPHSLGLLYSAFTYYLGFEVNDGEYKVMGLAPYGEPRYAQTIRDNLIDVKPDGSFRLNMYYFDYCTGLTMTNHRFDQLFGAPPRSSAAPVEQRHMDLARSVQVVLEEIVLQLGRTLHAETGSKNLCLAGGVALNCVANGRLLREGQFDDIWIQPAAGDAGGALGAALAVAHSLGEVRPAAGRDRMAGALIGPAFDDATTTAALESYRAQSRRLSDDDLFTTIAGDLAKGRIVGWFQDRMEFGPRALGNRSILADPRPAGMQRRLNLNIKYREGFRPFAPAVLAPDAATYFQIDRPSPYMLLVAPVETGRLRTLAADEAAKTGFDRLRVARSDIPAVTHVDNSARVQTVHPDTNPRFHRLLEAFRDATGCPVLVNTSFNTSDEPIVCSPDDAYRCFMESEIDVLVIGNRVLYKDEQC
ncbi:MAG: hypothetical protein EXQ90_04385 [Rhodospirillales bacterium]|nr:hypothetical protein [Rhodospirillales bacterium]